jgi:hypothetical protein
MHPHISFDFFFALQFAGLFEFHVHAARKLAVSASNPDVTEAEYTLLAEFSADIRAHIGQKVDDLFREKARLESQKAVTTEQELDDAKRKWQETVDAKEAALKEAYDAKTKKIADRTAYYNREAEEKKAAALEKQKSLYDAQNAFRKNVADAKAASAAERAKFAHELTAAQQDLETKRKYWNDEITKAHNDLDEKTRKLHSKFGDAQ